MTAEEIRRAAAVLFEPGTVVEVRAFRDNGPNKSAYFDDLDELAKQTEALAADPSIAAVTWTMNSCHSDLLARKNRNRFGTAKRGESTEDKDITGRRWLLVDIDPVRRSGIMATDDEKAAALAVGDAIAAYLDERGWPEPVVGDSGNGRHLLYRIDLPNDSDATKMVHRCLESLAATFNNDFVKVDVSVSNPSRLVRVYGTPNRKGSSTPERPHRKANVVTVPEDLVPVPLEMLQALAAESATTETTAQQRQKTKDPAIDGEADEDLDLRAWLDEFGDDLPFAVNEIQKEGMRFFGEITPCPWSDDHTDGAYIGQLDGGGIFARCHHNSCGGATGENRWQEIRDLVDPQPIDGDKKANTKPKKLVVAHFVKDDQLYLDVRDAKGVHWFAHLDAAGKLAFARRVMGANGIPIEPRELPIHQDSGISAPIVGIPSKEAMVLAPVLDARVLFAEIDRHLHQYIDVPDDERELFIYYIFYSWFYKKTRTAPYLRFIADTGKGKSRILRSVADLCFYPIRAAGSSSFSGIFRNKERWHGTLVLDESDLQGGAENPTTKYLNLGFEAGQLFLLTDKNNPNNVDIFDPFGPKVIGMRGPFGDVATEGRCLSFSPRETRRRDIPIELDAAYDEAVVTLRAHLARFALAHWSDVTTDALMDLTAVDVEPRLKQMLRPISLVLSVFPDGDQRLTEYVHKRQIEIRRTRSESSEGRCFNGVRKLAKGDEDLMDDPKFGKYYRHGELQAIEPRMISALTGYKTHAVSTMLRGIGFETKETSIKATAVGPAKDGEQGKIGERKLTVTRLFVRDAQAWEEMVSRYHFEEPSEERDAQGSCQTTLDNEAPPILECPEILRGPLYDTHACANTQTGTSGTTGTDTPRSSACTGSTGGTGTPPEHVQSVEGNPVPVQDDLAPEMATAAQFRFIQSNPHPCVRCGRGGSHYVASPSGSMTDPANVFICKACYEKLSSVVEATSGDEATACDW